MFFREWRLALVACAIIPVCAYINKVYGNFLSQNSKHVQTALAEANSVAQETISSIRTVFSFANEEAEVQKYREKVNVLYDLNMFQLFLQSMYYMVVSTFLVNCCVQVVILAYGSHLVLSSTMQASTLIAFMLYQGQLQSECLNFFNSFTNLIKSTGAGQKVFALMDRKSSKHVSSTQICKSVPAPGTFPIVSAFVASDHSSEEDREISSALSISSKLVPGECQGEIRVENVRFAYPSRPTSHVLKGVSFQVKKGMFDMHLVNFIDIQLSLSQLY
jgi:ATP-binding cassette subfamily B (MDR/TAP) protein 9